MVSVCFGLLLVLLLVAARAQQTARTPEALVLIHARGDQSLVALTFARTVSHEGVRQRIERLGALLGARVLSFSVEDTDAISQTATRRGRQTGVTALLSGTDVATGSAFRLQPFVEAMSDIGVFEVLFMVPRLANFTGVRYYESRRLRVVLVQDTGPYRYTVEVRPGSGPLPSLPLYQAVPPPRAHPASPGRVVGRAWLSVWMTAGVCGAFVFCVMLVRGRLRSGP